MILAGIDEAGYGPLLGPLVVSASVFRVPDEAARESGGVDLWKALDRIVCRKPDGYRIPVNDSKELFQQKRGVRNLEEGLFPFLGLKATDLPRDLRDLLARVARRGAVRAGEAREAGAQAHPDAYLDDYPWYRGRNVELPLETYPNFVLGRAAQLTAALEAAGITFLGLASRPIEVLELNRRLQEENNKARVSFEAVASFLKRLWKQFPEEGVHVTVDRQGGRLHYGPILFEGIRPRGIRIESQTEEASVYHLSRAPSARKGRTGAEPPTFTVSFCVESETRSLAVALASMLSKYIREVHMLLFNRFWLEQEPDLKPTAGYAQDGRRFLKDTEGLRRKLGIDDGLLVRNR